MVISLPGALLLIRDIYLNLCEDSDLKSKRSIGKIRRVFEIPVRGCEGMCKNPSG